MKSVSTRLASIVVLFLALAVPLVGAPASAQAANCTFVLGFETMHSLLGKTIGACNVDEYHNPSNGDGLQQTAHGLLVWRKADNWTAFTDGYHTWINGPFGVQERLNTACFWWENGCVPAANGSTSSSTSTTSSTSSTPTTVTFTSVTGAAPGGTASVSVNTTPNTVCTIDYWGPFQHDRYEFGDLRNKTSDGNGNVSWSWPISTVTGLGNGTVSVSCNGAAAVTAIPIGTAPVTVSFTSVTGAAPGGTASATIHTSPEAFCRIDYRGPRGVDRNEFGALHIKQADANGSVTWSWIIGPGTPTGNGTVVVDCQGTATSAQVPIS